MSVSAISSRRVPERGHGDAERWVTSVLGAIGDGLVTITAEGEVSSANAAAVRLLGDGVAVGASLLAALADVAGWPAELGAAIVSVARGVGTAVADVPLVVVRPDGGASEVEVAAYPLPPCPSGDPGAIVVVKDVTERNRTMRDLRASQQRYRDLFAHSRQAVVLTAAGGAILDLNQAAEELLGYRRERLTGTSLATLFVDREVWEEYRRLAAGSGGCTDLEARLRRASGQVRSCLLTMNVCPGSDGAPPEHQCIVLDVTDRKLLLESLRSFKLAVDSTQVGVTITDLDRRITFANRAEAEMHGYAPEELLGQHAGLLGGGPRQHPEGKALGEASRWRREAVNVRRDGSTFPVQLYSDVVRDETGRPVAVVTLCEDIRERVAAVERVRRLSHAVEQSPALVIITDTEGRVEYVNSRFTATTGYRPEEALGQSTNLLKSGEMAAEVYRELWATITRGGTWRGEFLNRKKDGSLYWAIASITGLADEQGRITSYVGIQEDITERKQMEEQLAAKNEELERLNRLKSDMVAITSHDLRSPLNAIISLASLLRDAGRGLGQAATQRTVEQIIASGRKLSSFVTDILDVEKLDAGRLALNPVRLALEEVVAGCVTTARAEGQSKGLAVDFRVEGAPGPVLGDPTRLEQVIGNLLSNAVKFSPQGGAIEVVVSEAGDASLVTVADHGPGIPAADLERIFDRYYQVSSNGRAAERGFGIGLGLYITRKLVTLHGGAVAAQNVAAGGCRFTVRLPGCERPSTEGEPS